MSTAARLALAPAALTLTLVLAACGPESEISDAPQTTGADAGGTMTEGPTESRVQDLPTATRPRTAASAG